MCDAGRRRQENKKKGEDCRRESLVIYNDRTGACLMGVWAAETRVVSGTEK